MKTSLSFLIIFSPENLAISEIMWEKYGRSEKATDDNIAHAHCMLDT